MNQAAVSGIRRDSRNLYIDALRGMSILLVMLLHYNLAYRLVSSPLQEWIPVSTLHALFYNGNYGVDIFFVISGFLITSNILVRYQTLAGIDAMHFYKLRFFRLYPLVVIALAIITALGLAGLSNFANAKHHVSLGNGFFVIADLSVLTFWHNILMESVGYFNYAMNIYWSLSVEEVFYLLYPLLLLVARRRWQLVVLACLGMVVAPIYRQIHRDDELFYLYGNLACVDMLTYGCVAAIVASRLKLAKAPGNLVAVLACVAMGWVYMRGISGNEALGGTFMGIAAAAFLVAVSGLSAGGLFRRAAGPLTWLGAHSYELYLFHIVVLGIVYDWIPRADMTVEHKLPILAAFFVLSAALAWLAARFCGDPLNRWLRMRFVKGAAGARGVKSVLSSDAI
ncbi:acyltransferase family protein [Dyella mobilis]|uniref:Acyltransferase n=1 Tax=Dyella mobilis TaxID=1849582 RepID=A0ABS2KJJ8_9GAMM|nr:acyltransferase [Dyella mobilis]MBM7131098.1 acyltransferase [Dyella mobilis]UDM84284.1 acyltransferase [Dyella mobilis]GLQ98975.1 acyltransferase [Dyella mobilis]